MSEQRIITKVDQTHKVRVEITGIKSEDAVRKFLLGNSVVPAGFDTSQIKLEKTENGFVAYPEYCCGYFDDGVFSYGINWFGVCEYVGPGCPA